MLKSPEEYRRSLKEMRPNVHKFGELIEDVTTHPATKRTVESHSRIYALAIDAEYEDILTTDSPLTGEKVSRYLSIMRSAEDMIANTKIKRLLFNVTGTCTGGRCGGWNGINAMWPTTFDLDAKAGTDYHERLKEWLAQAQRNDITMSVALTDPKGNRTLRPSEQDDPDMSLRMVERRDGGMVVRGAKIMICGVAAANEIFVMPGTAYGEADKDYAISFAIPRDAEGIRCVETTHPGDRRELEEGFDNPVGCGITQSYILFEDVFVPEERVFMTGEFKSSLPAVMGFIAPYRATMGGCVAGQGDVMVGASILIAWANGLSEKVFREKLTQMVANNETTFGMGVAAAVMGEAHPSGSWRTNQLLANVNKLHIATLPYETKRLAQEIGGGIAETGCMPSYRDMTDPDYGEMVKKYLKAAAPATARVRVARLIEWLTLGAGVPGCMHGGGSPDGARLIIQRTAEFDRCVGMAMELAGLEEGDISPPKKN
ncbi:MAG: 4-hydroxyphenylacetate 3-hydroxylase [Candidatus Thermoplasmatota archaeon]|nr:4-hydroxyphenylacetate 3-hydroxylase [Candidatus Thermoplasmatota archaeon]